MHFQSKSPKKFLGRGHTPDQTTSQVRRGHPITTPHPPRGRKKTPYSAKNLAPPLRETSRKQIPKMVFRIFAHALTLTIIDLSTPKPKQLITVPKMRH